MKLRNREHFTLVSAWAADTVLGTLRAHTVTKKPRSGGSGEVRFYAPELPYGGGEFALYPLLSGRNSWAPVLRCRLTEAGEGSCLTVDARCWWLTRAVMAVWYGLLALVTLVAAAQLVLGSFAPEMLGLPLFWAWGFALPHFAFWRPMKRVKAELLSLIPGEILED
jgi:hypothetical protein